MVLICCGDREWNNELVVRAWFNKVLSHSVIDLVIHGNARGADRMCAQVALDLNIPVKPFPANWALYGKAAGPIRNREMLKFLIENSTCPYVVAFHNDIENSKGTKDMIEITKKQQVIPYEIIRISNNENHNNL
jgi:hypothetical protein